MIKYFLSCEHGGNDIPEEYAYWFTSAQAEINSHKGIDFGTLDLFDDLQSLFNYSDSNSYCRLLVELNRSLHHPRLFSKYCDKISLDERNRILNEIYHPYRKGFIAEIEKEITQGNQIIHISLHSFTPQLNGVVRNTDIGLLYNPAFKMEKQIARFLKTNLLKNGYKVRYNYPYLGKADGFTTFLRKRFPQNYAGIELELNQKYAGSNVFYFELKEDIKKSLKLLTSGIISGS